MVGTRQLLSLATLIALMLPGLAWSQPGVPSAAHSIVTTPLTEDASVMVTPAGRGTPLTAAHGFGLHHLDATITIVLRDDDGEEIPLYPGNDIWVESQCLAFCAPTMDPIPNTDLNGTTQIVGPFYAGGCCPEYSLSVVCTGLEIGGTVPYLKFNSPDSDADLDVDLADVGRFTQAYFPPYQYCFDYNWDGVINLADLGMFARHVGERCP